jgi:putative FmdB family regulatory protein
MPIYQFDCADCQRRVDILFRSVNSTKTPICPQCGSKKLKRVMSRVARVKTAKQRFEDIDHARDAAEIAGRSDPATFARWARRVGSEYDEELGTNYRELAERAEAGEEVYERVDADYTFRHKVNEKLADMDRPPDAPAHTHDEHDQSH